MAPPLGSGAAYTVTRLLRVEGMVYTVFYGSSSGVGSCVHLTRLLRVEGMV